MLSIETEARVAKILITIAENEKEIEINRSGSENSVDEDDNEDENDENLIYRPGRLRSSLCVDDLFAC